ncbi:MAG: hypothetical protein AAFV62_04045 [Pseudomonadota bacterium]
MDTIGLYLIAFLAPALVFLPIGFAASSVSRKFPSVFANAASAVTAFAIVPAAVCYGVIFLIAALDFVDYIQKL